MFRGVLDLFHPRATTEDPGPFAPLKVRGAVSGCPETLSLADHSGATCGTGPTDFLFGKRRAQFLR